MAKQDFNEIVSTLQEAQKNKEHLEALTNSLGKYVDQQRKGLEELEAFVSQAREGKLQIKKRGGYRGRKQKGEAAAASE